MRKFWITLSLCVSLYGGWQLYQLASNPYVSLFVEVSSDELRQRLERSLLIFAEQSAVEAKLHKALEQTPADWILIDLLIEYSDEQNWTLDPQLIAVINQRDDEERSYWAAAQDCWVCVNDAQACPLSLAQICNVVTELTPVGDVRSLIVEYEHWQNNQEVDQLNVGLSVVGLGATALAVGTGGSSLTVKAGAGFLKAAKNAKRLNNKLTRFIMRTVDGLVDFSKIPKGWASNPRLLKQAIDPKKYRELSLLSSGLGDMLGSVGITRSFKYINKIDNANDAAKIGRLTKVGKSKALVALEMMGKSRLFKQMSKYSKHAKYLLATAFSLLFSILGIFSSAIGAVLQRFILRFIKRRAGLIS